MDASFSHQLNRTGICICIRDETGNFVLAKSIHISPMCSVASGEALALFYALEWPSDMTFDNVDFSSDSKVIINAFHKNMIDVTETGCILSACRRFFSSQFTNSTVEFHRRQANVGVHTLVEVVPLLASPPSIMYLVVLNKLLLMKCYKAPCN